MAQQYDPETDPRADEGCSESCTRELSYAAGKLREETETCPEEEKTP